MITLFIGRFQPFHNGHLKDILEASAFSEKVIIAIGSSNIFRTPENPFTFEERKEMIRSVIPGADPIPIPDINDDAAWVSHVGKIVGSFDIVYTGNDWVRKLFEKKRYNVRKVTLVKGISSTSIRKKILEKENWQADVPNKVASYLEEINGEGIIGRSEERRV